MARPGRERAQNRLLGALAGVFGRWSSGPGRRSEREVRRRCQARDETTSAGMITCAFIAGVNMTPDNRNTIPSAFINTADE